MTKKIIQTIIITLISVICVMAFSWGAMTIISPYTLGKMSQKLGDVKTASVYYEIDYKRNQSNSRVFNLTSSMFYAKKYSKTLKYGEKLLGRESFKNYVYVTNDNGDRQEIVNQKYLDTCLYVLHSKYHLQTGDVVEFLIENLFYFDGENNVVDFDKTYGLLTSIIVLAKDDLSTLDTIYSGLTVDATRTFKAENDKILFENCLATLYKLKESGSES